MKRIMAVIVCVSVLSMFKISACSEGICPVAENFELRTYCNTSLGAQLAAYDPEGGQMRFEISTSPIKGSLVLEEDGSFVYTPDEGRKGRDYFGYKAIDSDGNYSQEATVIINIERRKKAIEYTDMHGRAGEYSAVELYRAGLYTGERMGERYCFYPDKPMTRGEFLSLCMMISDKPMLETVYSTGYSDDESIPYWMKEYVAAAAMAGVSYTDTEYFNADGSLTIKEAAEILNSALNLNDVNYFKTENTVQACINLNAAGIIDDTYNEADALSREAAAMMLVRAMAVSKAN